MLYHSANSDFFHISFVNYCFLNHTFYYQDGFEMKFSTSSTYSTNEITSVMCSWNHLRFSPLYRLHLYDECYLEIYHCWTKQFLYIFFYFLHMKTCDIRTNMRVIQIINPYNIGHLLLLCLKSALWRL